jgi:hypothetical protein
MSSRGVVTPEEGLDPVARSVVGQLIAYAGRSFALPPCVVRCFFVNTCSTGKNLGPHVHLVGLEEEHLDLFLKGAGGLDGKLKLNRFTHCTALETAILGLLDNLNRV